MKQCKHCSVELNEENKGWGLQCYPCKNGLLRYGLNRIQQLELLESQDNSCALCDTPVQLFEGNNFSGVIDHCHTTGKVRGILCGHCNVALGKLESDNRLDKFLQRAGSYMPL
jgi:hypothetical protein